MNEWRNPAEGFRRQGMSQGDTCSRPAEAVYRVSSGHREVVRSEIFLSFCLGVVLPLVSLQEEKGSHGATLLNRWSPADLLALVLFARMALRYRLVLPPSARLYFLSLPIALVMGLVNADYFGVELQEPVIAFIALSMAAVYVLIGYRVAQKPVLIRALSAGLIVGVAWESIVVWHDYFSSSPWFPDSREMRVRGTFRSNGQLAGFALSATAILLSLGVHSFQSSRAKWVVLASGILAMLMIVPSARRSAIFAVAAAALLFLVLGLNRKTFKVYGLVAVCIIAGASALWSNWDRLSTSVFAARRTHQAIESIEAGDAFFIVQAKAVFDQWQHWFPLGMGSGLSDRLEGLDHEVHNAHLAIVTELGLLSLVGFYVMIAGGAWGMWKFQADRSAWPRRLAIVFAVAIMIFGIHNRIHRDRGLMLWIGAIAGMAASAQQARSRRRWPISSEAGPQGRTPRPNMPSDWAIDRPLPGTEEMTSTSGSRS